MSTPDRRRLRRRLVPLAGITVLGVLIAVALFATGRVDGPLVRLGLAHQPDPALQDSVHELFEQADADEVVVLADATDFEWDAVGVFGPYHPHDAIVERMGVRRIPLGATNNIVAHESYCLLVFRRGDRAVAWTTVGRDIADCIDANGAVYARDDARFSGDALRPTTAP